MRVTVVENPSYKPRLFSVDKAARRQFLGQQAMSRVVGSWESIIIELIA